MVQSVFGSGERGSGSDSAGLARFAAYLPHPQDGEFAGHARGGHTVLRFLAVAST
ncbi:hypothetical protein ACIQ9M_19765 [Streptomyces californicus]|uniref:hypothetical protein n=1 Tax=Streptomyces californicus TaxID=67351 RepID=UPI000AFBB375